MPTRMVLASVVALLVGAICFSFARVNVREGAKARKVLRIERSPSSQAPTLHLEWTDPSAGLTSAGRDELLRSQVVVQDFCKQNPKGCATLIDQVTEMLTPGNQLAPEILECRLAYETSDSREICDVGRRMIVKKEDGAHGRVIFLGFEAGQSKEPESACESLTAEARAVADGHASPMFIGRDGEDEAMMRAYREFYLRERLKFLRE